MGLDSLDESVQSLIDRGLAQSTLSSYKSGKKRYLTFCTFYHLSPLPLCESTLCRFVSSLHLSSLAYPTIKLYLSALRHMQIVMGLPDPSLSSLPHLAYVLHGIRRIGPSQSRPNCLPVTPELLRAIHQVWSAAPLDFDRTMLWAAFCLGFFGFMRSGEFTCPSTADYTPDMLSPSDVSVDSHSSPSILSIFLKRSKTDPFGAGLSIYLGQTHDILCPVSAVLTYLTIRPTTPGPLFIFSDGSSLSRPRLVHSLRQALMMAGFDALRFNGHSFRIGAALAAARAGLNDSLIKTLGRWHSSAYTRYIRTPQSQLAAVSAALVAV